MPRFWILTITGIVTALLLVKNGLPKLPKPTSASAQGQEAAPRAEEKPANLPDPETLLVQAIRTLATRHSAQAKLLVGLNVFGQQLVGSGAYLEQGPGRSDFLRWEVNIQEGDQTTRLMRISDGRRFWDYTRLAGAHHATARCFDRERFRRALAAQGKNPLTDLDCWPLVGGMSRVLNGLYRCFLFKTVESGRLDQVSVWRLEGQWRPAFLELLLPEQKKAIQGQQSVDFSKLPPQAPDRVVLFLGQDDLFPYRMECRRTLWPKDQAESAELPKTMVMTYLQLVDVQINVPIDPARFLFSPGDQDFPDQTEELMQQRNLKDY